MQYFNRRRLNSLALMHFYNRQKQRRFMVVDSMLKSLSFIQHEVKSYVSFRREGQVKMNAKNTGKRSGRVMTGGTDLDKLKQLADEEIERAVENDPVRSLRPVCSSQWKATRWRHLGSRSWLVRRLQPCPDSMKEPPSFSGFSPFSSG